MSKHYEVLHKAGKDRDLFSTSVPALPAGSSGAIMLNGNKRVHEETMKLIQRTFLSGTPGAPRILVFTAVDRGSGCSWVCAHTAKALAELVDGMVCVVEANPQAKSLQSQLNMSADCGHKDAASQQRQVPDFAKAIRGTNLWLVSANELPTDAAGLISFEHLKSRFAEVRSAFSYVLVDAPPVNESAESLIFGRMADGVVLVLEANATRREAARRAKECLEAANVKLLGAVLNKRTYPIPEALYGRI